MNTKVIAYVKVFPSDLNVERNKEHEFRMRCREVMDSIGLGMAWDNSHFISDGGGFWFHISCLDSVVIHDLDEDVLSITWIKENGTTKVLDIPAPKLDRSGLLSMRMQDSTRVQFEFRNLSHIEKLGVGVLLQLSVS